MYLLLIHLIVALLVPLATALTDPPKTYPNGTANPFYPCGYTNAQQAACPYRCYQKSGVSTAPTWSLLPNCYNDIAEINRLLQTDHICTQCELPSKFQPYDYPGGCQPLSDYFAGGYPSQCGFVNHRLRDCAWICGEAQVPFSVCSATDTTSEFSLCEKCKPQCSSPRIVFEPPSLPFTFSLSNGTGCGGKYGPPETVACPNRCETAGNPHKYCSLTNKTDGYFTTCQSCGG